MTEIRYDDIDALNARASDEFGDWGPPMTVTQEMIDQFSELTGDHQWIHTDVERAKRESPFGTTIAHGFLILSLLPTVGAADELTITGASSVLNYGADRLRFISPVPAGSDIHGRRRLVAAAARPRGTQVTVETELAVVGHDKPALLYRSLVLYLP